MPKSQCPKPLVRCAGYWFAFRSFEFQICFGFRYSDFGFREHPECSRIDTCEWLNDMNTTPSIDTTRLIVSMSPHLRGGLSIEGMMARFLLALVPTAGVGVYLFGLKALLSLLLAMATAAAVEAAIEVATKQEVTVKDLHALLTGLLVALILPPTAPWWLTMTGAGTAIILGKMVFGGLGAYPFNPPLVAWVVLKLSWPERMNAFVSPATGERVLTPLMAFQEDPALFYSYDLWDLFLGNQAGGIGMVCGLAILIGGIYLIARGLIRWHIPVAFLLGVAVFAGSCA
jgi:electron transport complex protein RnfD